MIRVRVPATSANMGPGFDSLGVALNLYNRMSFEETDGGLEITTRKPGGYVPDNENNLIYRAMKRVFDRTGYFPRGLRIEQKSDIPMTRGLGSSSACIIGGMLAANVMSGYRLSYKEILDMAAEMEGHPDNVAPALYGGFCAACREDGRVEAKSVKLTPKLTFAVMIPDYFVATKQSRTVLPDMVSRADASFNISRASLLTMALMSEDWELLDTSCRDRLHQPYRSAYIDGMEEIFAQSRISGAKAAYLSGSGPTIVAILTEGREQFCRRMEDFFRENSHKWTCRLLSADNVGAVVSQRPDTGSRRERM